QTTYLTAGRVALVGHPLITTAADTGATTMECNIRVDGVERWIKGSGNGPIAAFVDALGRDAGVSLELTDYTEHALGEGADASAVAYVEARTGAKTRGGGGVDANIVTASLRAVLSAVNRR